MSEKNQKNINVGFIFFKENMLQRIKMCYIPSLPPWKEKIVDIKKDCLYSQAWHIMLWETASTHKSWSTSS